MVENVENGECINDEVISGCHKASLDTSHADGILTGWCSGPGCDKAIVRLNPRTRTEEYLDGESPWTPQDNIRPVERQ